MKSEEALIVCKATRACKVPCPYDGLRRGMLPTVRRTNPWERDSASEKLLSVLGGDAGLSGATDYDLVVETNKSHKFTGNHMSNKTISDGTVHKMPADLRKALAADKAALALWEDITPLGATSGSVGWNR